MHYSNLNKFIQVGEGEQIKYKMVLFFPPQGVIISLVQSSPRPPSQGRNKKLPFEKGVTFHLTNHLLHNQFQSNLAQHILRWRGFHYLNTIILLIKNIALRSAVFKSNQLLHVCLPVHTVYVRRNFRESKI